MARDLGGADVELRALLFGGNAYTSGAKNTACRLSTIGMYHECRATAILSPPRLPADVGQPLNAAMPGLGGEQPSQQTSENQLSSDSERQVVINISPRSSNCTCKMVLTPRLQGWSTGRAVWLLTYAPFLHQTAIGASLCRPTNSGEFRLTKHEKGSTMHRRGQYTLGKLN
jgi:hypothetical protein